MRMSLLIAQRELREIVRDHNLLIPLLMLPCLMGVLTGLTAMTSARGPASVGLTVTSAVLDQLPNSAQQRLAVQAQAADGGPAGGTIAFNLYGPFTGSVPSTCTATPAVGFGRSSSSYSSSSRVSRSTRLRRCTAGGKQRRRSRSCSLVG